MKSLLIFILYSLVIQCVIAQQQWQSAFVSISGNQKLIYNADSEGNTIPDFSLVGYSSGQAGIPDISVQEIVSPIIGNNLNNIQNAIYKVSARQPDANGFRGAVLLKRGLFEVNGSIIIEKSGVVIKGEGSMASGGTIVRETASRQIDLFVFRGTGSMVKNELSKIAIAEDFVPVGRKHVFVSDDSSLHAGDSILIYRPATNNWIHDLKMDQIDAIEGTVQWTESGYKLYYERIVTAIEGNKISFDHPVVMQMDKKYGGGYLMKYQFKGRILNCGIENLRMESSFKSATDEDHGWNAISFSKVENCWVQNVTSVYFGMGCVNIDYNSRNISVLNSQCLDAKSIITGSRRYSFNCEGQLNLFKNCYTTEGRHDYVTGSRVCGPNVFTQCKSRNTHADIGPHHRWASGTLFDLIDTDGEINVQDRGNWGTGHGWAGVTQVVWNCKSPATAVQSPWVSGKNYCIGLMGGKYAGRLGGRPDGEWEGLNKPGLTPESLYEAQLKDRLIITGFTSVKNSLFVNVSPNPSSGIIQISHQNSQINYQLYDKTGRRIKSGIISGTSGQLDLTPFSNGIYLLDLFSGYKRCTHKIILIK